MKAYILTAVDYGDTADGKARTLGVFFSPSIAYKALDDDMKYYKSIHPTYKEGNNSLMDEDGNGCEWNIEDKEINIPLTKFQFLNLNMIAKSIEYNETNYFSYIDFSDEEDMYLLKILANRGIAIDKEHQVELRGEEARIFLESKDKKN